MKLIQRFTKYYEDPLYRNSYYLMLNSLISSFIGFIFWILMARFFDASNVGLATALISVSSIISIFSTFGLDISVIRFLGDQKEKKNYINTSITFISIAAIIISTIFLLGINVLAPDLSYVNDSAIFVILFFVYNVANGLFLFINNTFIALRDSKYVLFQNILVNLLRIPIPFFLVFLMAGFSIYASYSISMLITIIICLFFFLKKFIADYKLEIKLERKILSEISHFSAGNYVATMFGNLPPLIIPLIILQFLNPADNAYFFMAFTIASVLFVVPVAYSSSLLAEGSFDESKFFSNLKKTLKQTYYVLIPLIFLILIFGDKLLLIFGESYSTEGSLLLSLLAVSTIFIALNTLYTTYLRIKREIKQIMILTPVASILTIIISYILIPKIGIVGVGIGYLIAQILISSYVILHSLKRVIIRPN